MIYQLESNMSQASHTTILLYYSSIRCVGGVELTETHCIIHRIIAYRQDRFNPEFLAQIPKSLSSVVSWLPSFVEKYGGHVLGVETQFWCYGVRRVGGEDVATVTTRSSSSGCRAKL